MGVTFGTPVINGWLGAADLTFAMSGVTSGQPIVVVVMDLNGVHPFTPPTDSFPTPYTWTKIEDEATPTYSYSEMWIGTGGSGTSGTISFPFQPSGTRGGVAIPCLGASLASGLAAIDSSTSASASSGTTSLSAPAITPSAAGMGIIESWACGAPFEGSLTDPSSPWSVTDLDYAFGGPVLGVATYANAPATSQSATWGFSGGGIGYGATLMSVVVKAESEVTVPGTPTGVGGTPGNTTVALSWTVPANGGSAITQFTITPYIGATAQTPVTVSASGGSLSPTPGDSDSYTVTGLTNGTAYTFTVEAVNSVGTGAASAASNSVTPAAPAPSGGSTGEMLNLTLNFLAGTKGEEAQLCANQAWGAVNGHGAKAATLTAAGAPQLELIGALNAKNGTVGLGLDLVCNQLAGTVGLEADLAMRTYAGLS